MIESGSDTFLSIVVPLKDMGLRLSFVERWLREIPKSNVQVIFVVDNSTDTTFEKLVQLKNREGYSFITILNGNFGGPGPARNAGLLSVQAKWVAFWDSDDKPSVNNFIAMVQSAEMKNKFFAVGSWGEIHCAENELFGLEFIKAHKPTFIESVRNPGLWRWAIRTSEVKNTKFPDIIMGEDQVFLANLKIKWSTVYKEKKIVYNYIIGHSGQLTQNKYALNNRTKIHKNFTSNLISAEQTIYSFGIMIKIIVSEIFRWVQGEK